MRHRIDQLTAPAGLRVRLFAPLCAALWLSLGVASAAHAEHGSPGMRPWAPMRWEGQWPTHPTNTLFVLESHNGPSWYVHRVQDIALRSEGAEGAADVVPVQRVNITLGYDAYGYGKSIGVFKPVRALRPNTLYALVFEGETVEKGFYDPTPGADRKRHVLTLGIQTGAGPDTTPPRWRALDSEGGAWVAKLEEQGPYIFQVRAFPKDGSHAPIDVYLPLSKPGECRDVWFKSGAYVERPQSPMDHRAYRYTLSALDLAGNRAQAPGQPTDALDGARICLERLPAEGEDEE
jgi:hypothetical protein